MGKRGKRSRSRRKTGIQKQLVKNKDPIFILIRYTILLVVVFSLPAIYEIMTPLTILPLAFILDLIYGSIVILNSEIIINSVTYITIVPSCIAGSAYLLLFILNLAIPMDKRKRVYSLLVSFLALYILNLIRLVLFSILYHQNVAFVEWLHMVFWYGMSFIFVVFIWVAVIKAFSIKDIPVYTDLQKLLKNISR
jgi:exosortase/archaeosortase family protein